MNDQPAPIPTEEPAIVDLVIADLKERDRIGKAKYGTSLQAGNGRDHLRDAYEEALDLCQYLKAELVKTDWQPIGTAPKDGTKVLLFSEQFGYVVGWWIRCGDHERCRSELGWLSATHWMPLPQPPS